MIEQHQQIAKQMLKIIIDNNGKANTDQYTEPLLNNGFKGADIIFVRNELIKKGVLYFTDSSNYNVVINTELAIQLRYLPIKNFIHLRNIKMMVNVAHVSLKSSKIFIFILDLIFLISAIATIYAEFYKGK